MKLIKPDITIIPRDRIVDIGHIHDRISDFMLPIIDLAAGCYYAHNIRDYYGFEKGGNSSMGIPVVILCHRVIYIEIANNISSTMFNVKIPNWKLLWIAERVTYMV